MYLDKDTLPPTIVTTEADEHFALSHTASEVESRIREQTAALLNQLFIEASSSEKPWAYSVPMAMHTLDGSVNTPAAIKAGASQASSELYRAQFQIDEGRTEYPWVESRGTGVEIL